MDKKISDHERHVLNLIDKDCGDDGWTPVSDALYPVLFKNIHSELAEFEKTASGGRARLTTEGKNLLSALNWL